MNEIEKQSLIRRIEFLEKQIEKQLGMIEKLTELYGLLVSCLRKKW